MTATNDAGQGAIERLFTPANGKARIIFFAGKGGVGKTVVSCATAVKTALEGRRTLLVTTDPASHLGQTLEQEIEDRPTAVDGIENLWAARIDPQKAAESYKSRILEDARSRYGEDVMAVIEEQLDSPCTEEMAAFDRFVEHAARDDHEVIIFDTAPTGHTLRLLQLPIGWSAQLELQAGGSIIGDELNRTAKERFDAIIARMCDPEQTTFAFVLYPEYTPIIEAWRAAQELGEIGIKTALVVANFLLPEEHCGTPFFVKRRAMQQEHLRELKARFDAPVLTMPLLDSEISGLSDLRKTAGLLYDSGSLNA